MASAVRILGIDPGSVVTGLGLVELGASGPVYLHHAVVRTGSGPFPDRLKAIFDGVGAVIHDYQPDVIAVESVFMSRNADSALKLGQARGAAICAALAMHRPVAEYAPRHVKQAIVGRGAAEKRQLQHMIGVLLGLRTALPADAADALGVAVCHAHHLQTAQRTARNRSEAEQRRRAGPSP